MAHYHDKLKRSDEQIFLINSFHHHFRIGVLYTLYMYLYSSINICHISYGCISLTNVFVNVFATTVCDNRWKWVGKLLSVMCVYGSKQGRGHKNTYLYYHYYWYNYHYYLSLLLRLSFTAASFIFISIVL